MSNPLGGGASSGGPELRVIQIVGIGRRASFASPTRFDPLALIHGPYTIARLTPSSCLQKTKSENYFLNASSPSLLYATVGPNI